MKTEANTILALYGISSSDSQLFPIFVGSRGKIVDWKILVTTIWDFFRDCVQTRATKIDGCVGGGPQTVFLCILFIFSVVIRLSYSGKT